MNMLKKKQKKTVRNSFGIKAAIVAGLLLISILFVMNIVKEKPQEQITSTSGEQQLVLGLYPVIDKPAINEPGKVKITEFMSFYCDQCYRFNTIKHQLVNKYGDALEFKVVPIVWGEQSVKTVEAYILAERHGKGTEMADTIFNAEFNQSRNISDVNVLSAIGKQVGLGDEFVKNLKSGSAREDAINNIRQAINYKVNETPTLIVNGNIVVTPHPTGDDVSAMGKNLDVIIQKLLNK
ncbi:MAG TPA: hypothetical protein ENH28_07840 [Euryarchaeota archaeon]|nr:hypothetical protein [Euryarchaeota archaeon]